MPADVSNAQTVMVTVPDNAILEEGAWQRINLAASGGGADGATRNVNFYFRDHDVAPAPELDVSRSGQELVEGGDAVTIFCVAHRGCRVRMSDGDEDPGREI